ncbi:MAG: Asp23/Gls24 family envelope stress response protein [Ruminococcus sp.]|nr:Asp23/Gls24 family envelope stress response protein [Ruminococcus sp.]MBQ3947031.1 Asp23/Gls24 family envelope stress response protein [Ruminococcus sp.]MCR5730084.1 Asp23/Gls24 family envelope stress response protein [Ruminococcus sp.]
MVNFENHIGKITVSENYLTEIVKHAVTGCFGVAGVCSVNTLHTAAAALTFGRAYKKQKGVAIRTDKNGGLIIDLHIKVTYGTNITAAVSSIIHKVTFTVEEAIGSKVRKVNVYVDEMTA